MPNPSIHKKGSTGAIKMNKINTIKWAYLYGALSGSLFGIFMGVCWFVNIYKIFQCDWDAPWKDEIIHLIGLFPPASLIAVWF